MDERTKTAFWTRGAAAAVCEATKTMSAAVRAFWRANRGRGWLISCRVGLTQIFIVFLLECVDHGDHLRWSSVLSFTRSWSFCLASLVGSGWFPARAWRSFSFPASSSSTRHLDYPTLALRVAVILSTSYHIMDEMKHYVIIFFLKMKWHKIQIFETLSDIINE